MNFVKACARLLLVGVWKFGLILGDAGAGIARWAKTRLEAL